MCCLDFVLNNEPILADWCFVRHMNLYYIIYCNTNIGEKGFKLWKLLFKTRFGKVNVKKFEFS